MTATLRALLVAAILAMAVTASAQEPGRYQLERVDGGFLRLDTLTGAIDICRGAGAAWRCEAVVAAPNRPAGSGTDAQALSRVTAERDRLATALAEIRALAEAASQEAAPAATDLAAARRDIDDAVEVTEYAIRRFRDLLTALEPDEAPDDTPDSRGR